MFLKADCRYWNPVTCSLDKPRSISGSGQRGSHWTISKVWMRSTVSIRTPPLANANLATIADHAGWNIPAYIQAELLQVQAHTGQHLEQSHLLLCGLVNQGWTSWIALWPLTVIDEMKGTALQSSFAVLIGLLKTFVPALQSTGKWRPLDLEIHPITERQKNRIGKIAPPFFFFFCPYVFFHNSVSSTNYTEYDLFLNQILHIGSSLVTLWRLLLK